MEAWGEAGRDGGKTGPWREDKDLPSGEKQAGSEVEEGGDRGGQVGSKGENSRQGSGEQAGSGRDGGGGGGRASRAAPGPTWLGVHAGL